MIFSTSFRPIYYVLILPTVLLFSGCVTQKHPPPLWELQPTLGRHFSKIFHPAADRRPYLESKNSQLRKMRWLVDSGATHSVIFDSGKKSLEAIITGNAEATNNVHGMFSTERKKLSLFSYQASPQGDGIPDITGYTLSPRNQQLSSRADGILGIHSLKLHDAIMFPRQKTLLWNARRTHIQNTTKVNLRRHSKSGHLMATVYHGNHALHLILDTGASKSIISYASAQKIKSSSSSRMMRLHGVHQSRSNKMSVKKLKIRLKPSQPEINAGFIVSDLSNLRKDLNSNNDNQIDGILGYDIISRYCHAIDFGRGLLYLTNTK